MQKKDILWVDPELEGGKNYEKLVLREKPFSFDVAYDVVSSLNLLSQNQYKVLMLEQALPFDLSDSSIVNEMNSFMLVDWATDKISGLSIPEGYTHEQQLFETTEKPANRKDISLFFLTDKYNEDLMPTLKSGTYRIESKPIEISQVLDTLDSLLRKN